MTTKRTPIAREARFNVTPAIVAAYKAGDYHELHRLCGLKPWHSSPLPLSVTALGCEQREPEAWRNREDWEQAGAMQRAIKKASR